jgi:formamidopyrimidine-DNA glycosylase
MPELPEVEHLRRTLEPRLVGRRVVRARLRRPDVLRAGGGRGADRLLQGAVVESLLRHGKQLAIVASSGRVLCVHLGMSGQLRCLAARRPLPMPVASHVHCVWDLDGPADASGARAGGRMRMYFRDPRRFGGIWAFPSLQSLWESRWNRLGPDALAISTGSLRAALAGRRRPVKASLLEQSLIAGLGNIYADEALFDAGVHPLRPAHLLTEPALARLAASIRRVLRRALASGGSSLRDYVDAEGRPGRATTIHRVYGRGGRPCPRCGRALSRMVVAQRTTVACAACQRLPRGNRASASSGGE